MGFEILAGGTKSVAAAATPERLTDTDTPCAYVLVQPKRTTAGAALNTKVVKIGKEGLYPAVIAPTDTGIFLPIENANTLWVQALVNGEGIEWTVFG